MKKNIVLIGFMGSGKSTLAQILHNVLDLNLISTDRYIEESEGRSIEKIFKDSGQEFFRSLEHRAVVKIASQNNVIIDCGGGVVLNPDNIKALKEKGIIVYLACDPQIIYERVQAQPKRPLLDVPDPMLSIQELLKIRKPLYELYADWTFDTSDGNLNRVAQEIKQRIEHE